MRAQQYVLLTEVELDELASGRAIQERFGAPPANLGKEHPVWEDLAEIVAVGLHNTIAYWSPEKIVVGGSMMREAGIPLERSDSIGSLTLAINTASSAEAKNLKGD